MIQYVVDIADIEDIGDVVNVMLWIDTLGCDGFSDIHEVRVRWRVGGIGLGRGCEWWMEW
jgi:hypothetical protein